MILSEMVVDIGGMQALAVRIAEQSRQGDMMTLKGEVGAGKTTFARAFIQAIMTQPGEVTSPTFNLMQSYEVSLPQQAALKLWHLDLYRLEHLREADALGLEELEKEIILIEWPELIEARLPAERLDVCIAYADTPDKRMITLKGNDAWRNRWSSIKSKL